MLNEGFVEYLIFPITFRYYYPTVLVGSSPLFGKYLSKAWQYYIWLIVLVRLLVPLSLPISPVGNLFTKAAPSIQALQVPRLTNKTDGITQEVEPDADSAITSGSKHTPSGYEFGRNRPLLYFCP